MAQINLEIGTKGNEALKKLQDELKVLRAELDKLGKSTDETTKKESGLAAYRKQQIKEMRDYRFVVGEMRDAIGGASIALSFMSMNSTEAGSSVKQLSNSVNSGFAAFSAADAIVGALGTQITALAGPMGIAISIGAALAGVIANIASENSKAAKDVKELNNKLLEQAYNLKQISAQKYADGLTSDLSDVEKELSKVNEEIDNQSKLFKRAGLTQTEINEHITSQLKERNELELKKGQIQGTLSKVQDDMYKGFKDNEQDYQRIVIQNSAFRKSLATKDAKELIKIKYDSNIELLIQERDAALKSADSEETKKGIRQKYNAQIESENLNRKKDLKELTEKEIETTKQYGNKINELSLQANIESLDYQANYFKAKNKNALQQAAKELEIELQKNEARKKAEYAKPENQGQSKEAIQNREIIKTTYENNETQIRNDNYVKVVAITEEANKKKLELAQTNATKISQLNADIMDAGLEKEKAILTNQMNEELKTAETNEEAKELIREKYRKLQAKADLDNQKKIAGQILNAVKQAGNTITQFGKQQSDAKIDNIETEKEAKLSQIDAELENDRLTEEQRNELLAKRKAVETEYNNQVKAEKEAQWKAERDAKVIMAIIDTASAVVEALPNVPLSILAGVLGTAQVGLIASQPTPKFHTGGIIGQEPLQPNERLIVGQVGETIRTQQQERELGNTSTKSITVIINNNSPFTDVDAVKKAVEKGLKTSNLTVDKYFVNKNKNVTVE